jgi:hypothetical protein
LAFPGGAVWAALPSRPAAAGLSGRISPPTPLPGEGARFLIGAESQRMSMTSKQPACGEGREQGRPNFYQEVTDTIIAGLEQGRVPWVQPWGGAKAGLGLPKNATTGRRYSGVNILILWGAVIARGFAHQHWLTFRQALDLGGNVRKGERGTTVCSKRHQDCRDRDEMKLRAIQFQPFDQRRKLRWRQAHDAILDLRPAAHRLRSSSVPVRRRSI